MIGLRLGPWVRRLFRGGNDAGSASGSVWSIVFLAAAAAAVLVVSVLYYKNYRADFLRQAESQLRTVADVNRRIVDCNRAFAELFGYRLAHIRGKPSSHIYAHEADFTAMGETNVVFVEDEDGKTSGFIGLIRDVTGQKEVETELRQAQKMEAVGRLRSHGRGPSDAGQTSRAALRGTHATAACRFPAPR